ncbi:MAG: 2-hydroxyacid dehydrogenase [Nitrospirales bacterium]
MARPALYLSRLLPDPVMSAIHTRFTLVTSPPLLPPLRADLLQGIRQADAAICTLTERIDREVLDAASRLRIVANYAVGFNNIDLETAKARGVAVTNTPDVLTEATADLTWALLLATARRLVEGDGLARSGAWAGWSPTELLGLDVSGKTLGIVGMGRIGQAVARRASGFDMAVRYTSHRTLPQAEGNPRWQQGSLEEVLRGSDFVSLHVPLTPETHHLIGDPQLRLMRPTAVLLNTSRGPIVHEAALVSALQRGQLAGAGLDVYEDEPAIPAGLRHLKQVVLLPHLGSATLQTRVRMGMVCLENVEAALAGRPVPNRVA